MTAQTCSVCSACLKTFALVSVEDMLSSAELRHRFCSRLAAIADKLGSLPTSSAHAREITDGMVPCAGTTGAQKSRHQPSVLAGPSCSLRLLTPHSRCSQFSTPGEQPGDIMRCHEIVADITALADTRLRPLPCAPLLLAVRSGALGRPSRSGPARMVRRSMPPWPASRAPLVLLRLSALPTTLFLAEPRTIPTLLSPALIVTTTPATRPAWGPSLSATLSLDLIVWTVRQSGLQRRPTDVKPSCIA